ncbi:MAG TPA: ABC transporter permease [Puia sp.]|uniref:ABC transporter permease n=1 Tax=Puia sp. TaxID=2045100 RepID=UPI002C34F92B|nr:ABC transporter permease [Puia sp.]HVU98416.1 ABC transporter permease [Puia sp.]
MLKNYCKIAFRSLFRNRFSSIINIGGLAIGITVAILIGLWISDELSFDKYHDNYDRIAQVWEQQTLNGAVSTFTYQPFAIGKLLRTEYASDFKYVVMASQSRQNILSIATNNFVQNGIYMEEDAPKMLTLKMLEGTRDGLNDPHSILLSASAAKAIFGTKPATGSVLKLANKYDVKVTGVYEDLPYNTSFHDIAFIAPWKLYITTADWIRKAEAYWDNNSFQTFVQLAGQADLATVNKKIVNCKQTRVEPEDKKYQTKVFLNPMRDWHLRSNWDSNGKKGGGPIEYVWLFGVIGIFVLILACINFMNLSTARSERRAREVGIRKTIGSLRRQIIAQFYSESLLIVFAAFILAILVVQLSLPFFNEIAGKGMTIPYANPLFWILCIGFTLACGLLAGSYPALYLSSFNPVKVLKGTFKAGHSASLPRKVLVVIQFTISIVLAIGTIIVYNQVQYARNRPIGYDRQGLMMISMRTGDFYGKFGALSDALKSTGAVKEFAESHSPLNAVWSSNDQFAWPGSDPDVPNEFNTIWVTHDFGKTVGWQFTAGRDFSRDYPTDTTAIIANEAAIKFMGLKNPVGATIKWGLGKDAKNFKLIGVIKNMVTESPFAPVRQAFYFLDYNNVNWMILKLDPNKSAKSSIATIQAVFKKFIPSAPFDYTFADSEFAAKFATEEKIGKLSSVFATLAIFISCLGLFGLASFVAEQRTKEMGVRKVLGASALNVWKLLTGDFVMLVGISLLVAIPLAYYCMHQWLQSYSYRTGMPWWIFAAAAAGALMLTIITVSFQAARAAFANPVKSLRSE